MKSGRSASPATALVRCGIYTRKSTDENLDLSFNSLDAQRESAEAYIRSQESEGWMCLPDRYDDGGFTGGNTDRPALKRLLTDIEAGGIDCVVVYKVDRLSRSLLDFARLLETFEKHNVTFVAVTQQFSTTTSVGRLTMNMLLSFAQFERELVSERTRDKIAAARRKGKWSGGHPLLGYDIVQERGGSRLAVNDVEAVIVRQIFDLYSEHRSLHAVARELDARGWVSKRWTTHDGRQRGGRRFDKASLYNLLTNVLYVGKVRHNDNLYAGEHSPIVTPEVFDRVQQLLAHNGRTGGADVRNKYGAVLKGLLHCKSCGCSMVRTVRNEQPRDGIVRSREAVVIRTLPLANLRVRLTRLARFLRVKDEVLKPAHPTAWLVGGIDTRGSWPGIRSLAGISEVPILRADGSICQTPGHDAATGVLYNPKCEFPQIRNDVDIDDAQAALDDLHEVICDFHFESEDHKATWLAALLTVIGRHAFGGPAPLFLVDANIRGAGKGLLVQCIARIVLGHEMPVSSYAHNTEEMRKQITSIAIAGDSMILLDNLEGQFGNDTLDRALTSTRWKDRVLGKSELVDLPLLVTWFGTGNNVMVGADTLRRILHIRLDVLHERPEDRKGFKHPHLLSWITSERPRLLTAALKILAAYVRAGRQRQNLTAFGSFEGWSDLIREAVVWLGLPDPCNTRTRLAEMADTVSDGLGQLMKAWEAYDPDNQGLHLSEVIASLYPQRDGLADPAAMAMRSAIELFINCPPTRHPTAKQLGNRLRHYRRRVVNGLYFDCSSESRRHGMLWRLIKRSDGA